MQIVLRGSPGKGDNYHFLLNICYSLLKKALFKMAFHGGSGNVWSGLMQTVEVLLSLLFYLLSNHKRNILQVRQLTRCLTAHDECLDYQVVRGEWVEHLEEEEENEYSRIKI